MSNFSSIANTVSMMSKEIDLEVFEARLGGKVSGLDAARLGQDLDDLALDDRHAPA